MATYMDEVGDEESELDQELELLQAIYIHELEIQHDESGHPAILSLTLHPSTADNADLQYVCLTLVLMLTRQYPDVIPEISIKNSRGISDEQLQSISNRLYELAEEQMGSAMLYALIEVAKETLTHNNTPYGQCVICQEDFKEGEAFTKTACYHHFHCDCLARYIQHALANCEDDDDKKIQNQEEKDKEQVVCAVCREPIQYDLEQLRSAPAHETPNVHYTPDQDMQELQEKMAALYMKQKEKGGIIDIEAESNKFLIDISVTPTIPMNSVIGAATPDDNGKPVASQKLGTDSNEQIKKTDNPREGRSEPRTSYSEKKRDDTEKRTDRAYDDRKRGRGRGRSRPISGKYADRDDTEKRTDRAYDDRKPGRGRGRSRPISGRYADGRFDRNYRGNWRDEESRRRPEEKSRDYLNQSGRNNTERNRRIDGLGSTKDEASVRNCKDQGERNDNNVRSGSRFKENVKEGEIMDSESERSHGDKNMSKDDIVIENGNLGLKEEGDNYRNEVSRSEKDVKESGIHQERMNDNKGNERIGGESQQSRRQGMRAQDQDRKIYQNRRQDYDRRQDQNKRGHREMKDQDHRKQDQDRIRGRDGREDQNRRREQERTQNEDREIHAQDRRRDQDSRDNQNRRAERDTKRNEDRDRRRGQENREAQEMRGDRHRRGDEYRNQDLDQRRRDQDRKEERRGDQDRNRGQERKGDQERRDNNRRDQEQQKQNHQGNAGDVEYQRRFNRRNDNRNEDHHEKGNKTSARPRREEYRRPSGRRPGDESRRSPNLGNKPNEDSLDGSTKQYVYRDKQKETDRKNDTIDKGKLRDARYTSTKGSGSHAREVNTDRIREGKSSYHQSRGRNDINSKITENDKNADLVSKASSKENRTSKLLNTELGGAKRAPPGFDNLAAKEGRTTEVKAPPGFNKVVDDDVNCRVKAPPGFDEFR